jgi:hypothetical protein
VPKLIAGGRASRVQVPDAPPMGKLPPELVAPRDWRTHEDAFLEHWPELEAMLRESPALEAKTLFDVLVEKHPGRYEEGQLRTLQRRVKAWRAERGPDKDVLLAQIRRAGASRTRSHGSFLGSGTASFWGERSSSKGGGWRRMHSTPPSSPAGATPNPARSPPTRRAPTRRSSGADSEQAVDSTTGSCEPRTA